MAENLKPRSEARQYVEKRRRVDPLTKSIQIFGWIAWGCAVSFFGIWALARPSGEDFFTRVFESKTLGGWNWTYLSVSFWIMWVTFIVCFVGLIVNALRHKRKTDRFNKSLIILAVLALISSIAFVITFGMPF